MNTKSLLTQMQSQQAFGPIGNLTRNWLFETNNSQPRILSLYSPVGTGTFTSWPLCNR